MFPGLIGTLFGKISKFFRWRPIGKRVRITVVESRDGSLLGQNIKGRITNIAEVETSTNSHQMDECPFIQFDSPVHYMGYRFNKIMAVPRHTGYDLYTLPFTGIAVYVVPILNVEELPAFNMEDVIAIWGLSLCRFRHSK